MSAGRTWRTTAATVAALTTLGLLGACGGPSAYCQTVEDDQQVLDAAGSSSTTAAYTEYATVLSDISKVAPAESKEQWTTLAETTRAVLAAHDAIGFALDDMGDADARANLSEADTAVLEEAYAAFNDTTAEREAVIENVQSSCDIELQ